MLFPPSAPVAGPIAIGATIVSAGVNAYEGNYVDSGKGVGQMFVAGGAKMVLGKVVPFVPADVRKQVVDGVETWYNVNK